MTLSNWMMADSFNWKEILYEHQMCKDSAECLCFVLLATHCHNFGDPNTYIKLENRLVENQKEIAARLKEMEENDE